MMSPSFCGRISIDPQGEIAYIPALKKGPLITYWGLRNASNVTETINDHYRKVFFHAAECPTRTNECRGVGHGWKMHT